MKSSSKNTTSQEYWRHPFLLPVEELFKYFETSIETGLSVLKAQEAQRNYGPNKLNGEGAVQWYSVLLKQVSNAMILVCFFVVSLSS